MNKHYSRMMSCGLMVIAFFLMPVFSASALSAPSSDHNYWRWWYVEQSTGVSVEDANNTDYGIGTGEYISNNGGGSRADAYTWVKDKYDNAVNATANSVDYYYNVVDDIYNKSVDYAEKGYYTAENALRKTVDTAGKTVYNVSSSDFWNGFYNSMFNGGGYNQQYQEGVNNNSYNIPTDAGNVQLDVFIATKQKVGNRVDNTIFINAGELISANYNNVVIKATYNNESVYYGVTGDFRDILYIISTDISIPTTNRIAVGVGYNDGWNTYTTITIDLKDRITGNAENNTTPIPQPSQMGFIINPQTGERIPVYTDTTTKNPFTINPDGTVTLQDGTTVPIYVDPDEISGDGWLWLLKYIDDRDNTDPNQNPFGQPWNTQNDGTVLGGLFTNLLKDISSIFSGIADTIKNLIDGLIKAIADLFKIDFSLLNNIHLDVDFNIIQTIIDKLLQFLGVT